jgi:hypothetical protein
MIIVNDTRKNYFPEPSNIESYNLLPTSPINLHKPLRHTPIQSPCLQRLIRPQPHRQLFLRIRRLRYLLVRFGEDDLGGCEWHGVSGRCTEEGEEEVRCEDDVGVWEVGGRCCEKGEGAVCLGGGVDLQGFLGSQVFEEGTGFS